MREEEIIQMWQRGISKNQIAKQYKCRYNQRISIIRLDQKNRHAGSYISHLEALAVVEKIIYREVMKR